MLPPRLRPPLFQRGGFGLELRSKRRRSRRALIRRRRQDSQPPGDLVGGRTRTGVVGGGRWPHNFGFFVSLGFYKQSTTHESLSGLSLSLSLQSTTEGDLCACIAINQSACVDFGLSIPEWVFFSIRCASSVSLTSHIPSPPILALLVEHKKMRVIAMDLSNHSLAAMNE